MVLHSYARKSWSYTALRRFSSPLAGAFAGLSLAIAALPATVAHSAEISTPAAPSTEATTLTSNLLTQAERQVLSDGVYLYGQATEPEQMGSAYMVFEVNQDQIVGAFYMPHSSFDCFEGQLQPDRLALNVVNSYEQTAYPYSVALETSTPIASATGEAAFPVGLEGFHRIDAVSDNDQRILATCQADFQQ